MTLHLTPTEREVLTLMTYGKTAGEIAIVLGNSRHTVRKHIETIRGKFDVFKDTALVASALRSGIIE